MTKIRPFEAQRVAIISRCAAACSRASRSPALSSEVSGCTTRGPTSSPRRLRQMEQSYPYGA